MVRMLNFFCVALAGLACLALYRISEQTRIAQADLSSIDRQIVIERSATRVLEADWQSVASPARIERLAESRLGAGDTTTVQLSSFQALPMRGEDALLNSSPIAEASVKVDSQATPGQ